MTLISVRSQPGMWLSGSPPSDPLSILKRATRRMISVREKPRLGNVSINSLPFLTLTPRTRPATQGWDGNRHLLQPNATRPMLAGKVLLSLWSGFCQRERANAAVPGKNSLSARVGLGGLYERVECKARWGALACQHFRRNAGCRAARPGSDPDRVRHGAQRRSRGRRQAGACDLSALGRGR